MPVQPTHVWVASGPGRPPSPGILMDWRQDDSGSWEASVLYVSFHLEHPVEEPHIHFHWIRGELVTKR